MDDRVARAPMRTLDIGWSGVAKRWALQHGHDVRLVLDLFDELAALYTYGGDSWPEAQARAWPDTVALLTQRAETGAA